MKIFSMPFFLGLLNTVYSTQTYYKPQRDKSVNIVTYNTGLGGVVRWYTSRRIPLINTVLETDADVLCFNEIWYANDMIRMQKTLRQKYPYSFSTIHNDDQILLDNVSLATPPCDPIAAAPVLECVAMKCKQPNVLLRYICFLTTCKGVEKLSEECTACVLISGDYFLVQKCVQPQGPVNAFTGDGLAIFSKYPLSSRVARDLNPGYRRLQPRWLLSAKVKGLGTFGCTHLTSPYPMPYYDPVSPPLFKSYEEQNLNNTLEVLKLCRNQKRCILAGDTNQSPKRDGIVPVFADNYNRILEAGLVDPYVDNNGPGTFGSVNGLSFFQDGDYIFDHIFQRGFHVTNTKRMFEWLLDVGETSVEMSDHYGVSVTVQRKRKIRRKYYGRK